MATRRFELSAGKSSKFWEIRVSGAKTAVRYGRIGTDGQTKEKSHGSAADAREAAETLIASKVKKGYAEVGGKKKKAPSKKASTKKATKKKASTKKTTKKASTKKASTKKTTKKKTGGVGATPELVVRPRRRQSFAAVWADGKDLWIAGLRDEPASPDGKSFEQLLKESGYVERWRFASPRDAATAVKAMKAEKTKRTAKIPDWVDADPSGWGRFLKEKDRARIPRFAVSKSGPVTLSRHAQPDWVLPRPPTHCTCGRVLLPTFELSGPLDKRLGRSTSVYVSFCPGGLADNYCEGEVAVIVQSAEQKKPRATHYFLSKASYWVITESLHWNPIGDSEIYVVTEHFGHKSEPGTCYSKHFFKKKQAEEHLKKTLYSAGFGGHEPAKPSAFGKWYRDHLKEMHRFHRVKGAEPKTLKLKPVIPAMEVSGTDSYGAFSPAFFEKSDSVGGQPNYTQSAWHRRFPCPTCKKTDMLFVLSAGSGAPWMSDVLNDGDAGSFDIFVCPKCRGPFGRALFESH